MEDAKNSKQLIQLVSKITEPKEFIKIDDWVPKEEDMIFKQTKGAIILPISKYYNIVGDNKADYFKLNTKRCYNSDEVRLHICQYMNYFEKFYDTDRYLVSAYCQLKYLIDCEPKYDTQAFFYDLKRYILSGMVFYKLREMNRDNYSLDLNYSNKKNPGLQYNNKHGAILMEISIQMDAIIPLLTHFTYVKKIQNVKFFLLKAFEMIFNRYDTDIINKLYETTLTTVNKSKNSHPVLWSMQNIRSRSTTTHSIATVGNIILQIIPKYTYNKNVIYFNFISITKGLSYQIIDISYEYSLISLSSSKRDEDNNSEFDKFEAHSTKENEALYIQNKVNCQETMKLIELKYGPFEQDEINFYIKELTRENKIVINSFQKRLIFSLFYKYFNETQSIKAINQIDYIKLMIAAKKILEIHKMVVLPYIISSKVEKIVNRQNINKKELTKLEMSQYYPLIREKYRNNKIEKEILAIIATILSSKFRIIDYHNPDINGKIIDIIPDYICEEVLTFISLI